MSLATIRDAGRREARAERDQFAATGGPDALAEAAWEPGGPPAAHGGPAIVPSLPQIDLPGPRATTLAQVGSVVIARASALRERFHELGDIAPAWEPARFLKAAGQWLGPRERRTRPAAFRMAFTRPETPSPAEMTIIETPFRIPRYMDHPEWRPR
jgi:hypothetical protein